MKTQKIIILVLALALNACGPESKDFETYKYRIENNSDYSVKIIPYNTQGAIQSDIIILEPNSFVEEEERAFGNESFDFANLLSDSFIDKVVFIFNSERKIEYERCPISNCGNTRNIFDLSNNDELIEVYLITNSDFDNAQPCSGGCD